MRRRGPHTEGGVIGRDLDPEGPAPRAHREPHRWEQRALDNERARADTLNMFRQMTQHLGGLLDLAKAAPKADVLAQMLQTIPSNGVLQRQWSEMAQSVTIANYGMADMVATASVTASQAPTVGSGVALIPGGTQRTVHIRGNAIQIYGNPGDRVEFVAWARPRPPHAGPVDPGTTDGVLIAAPAQNSRTVQLNQSNAERLVVVQNVEFVAGGSLQTSINGITPSGYVYPILVGSAVTAPGIVPLRVGPALTPSANAVANDLLPREVQIVTTVAATCIYGLDFVAGR